MLPSLLLSEEVSDVNIIPLDGILHILYVEDNYANFYCRTKSILMLIGGNNHENVRYTNPTYGHMADITQDAQHRNQGKNSENGTFFIHELFILTIGSLCMGRSKP